MTDQPDPMEEFPTSPPLEADASSVTPEKKRRWTGGVLLSLLLIGSAAGITWLALSSPPASD
jgi:hypothetical protein